MQNVAGLTNLHIHCSDCLNNMVHKAISFPKHIPVSLQADLLAIPGVTSYYETGGNGSTTNHFRFISPIQFGSIRKSVIPEENQKNSILLLCCATFSTYQTRAKAKCPRVGDLDWIDQHPSRAGLSSLLKRWGNNPESTFQREPT